MKKILRLTTTLMLLIFLGGNAWGQTEIFNHAGGGTAPSGWTFENNNTTNNIDKTKYWLVETNPTDIITTASYDLSSYTSAVFNVDVASYGSGEYNPAKIEISYDGGSNYTQTETTATTTGSSYITGGPINLNSVSATVVLKISNNGATGRGVRLQNLVLTATVSSGPTISVLPSTLTNFTYVEGSGPSAEQSFTVQGSDLTADISIAATTNYEISTGTGGSFSATDPITLTQTGGSVSSTTIYVRLKAGLSVGDYNNEVITATSTGADNKTVTCSGSVTAPPAPDAPVATAATAVGSNGFTANWNASAGATGYFLDVYHA
ncbi:MAG: hypothetical protein EOM83_17180, partial [Clostridia bacterium]|nr:hypothetical protein [Clostridia bacterium]